MTDQHKSASDYLRSKGATDAQIAASDAAIDQHMAWVGETAGFAVEAYDAQMRGDWDQVSHMHRHLVERIATLGIDPNGSAGVVIEILLAQLATITAPERERRAF